jgi:hypothetical protein
LEWLPDVRSSEMLSPEVRRLAEQYREVRDVPSFARFRQDVAGLLAEAVLRQLKAEDEDPGLQNRIV